MLRRASCSRNDQGLDPQSHDGKGGGEGAAVGTNLQAEANPPPAEPQSRRGRFTGTPLRILTRCAGKVSVAAGVGQIGMVPRVTWSVDVGQLDNSPRHGTKLAIRSEKFALYVWVRSDCNKMPWNWEPDF